MVAFQGFRPAFSPLEADDEVDNENYLESEHQNETHSGKDSHVLHVLARQIRKVLKVVDSSCCPADPKIKSGINIPLKEITVPQKMDLPPSLIHHTAEHLGKPMIDSREDRDYRDRHKRVVGQHEVRVVKVYVHAA